jgi:hypothetical protein
MIGRSLNAGGLAGRGAVLGVPSTTIVAGDMLSPFFSR